MTGRITVAGICLLLGAAVIARASRLEQLPPREPFSRFPVHVGLWRGVDTEPLDERTLEVLHADDYLSRVYRSPRGIAGLFIAYYESQRGGDSMHSPLNCLPGSGWEPLEKSYLPVAVTDAAGRAQQITVNKYVIQKGLDQQVVLYWYQSHGRVVANEYRSKIFMVYDAARLNRSDAALVRVTSPRIGSDGSGMDAETRAVEFLKAVFPVVARYVPD